MATLPRQSALYSIEQIRIIESAAKADLAPGALMLEAGKAAANVANFLLLEPQSDILVLVGPGDNGGDALEVAHLLANNGHHVAAIMCADEDKFSEDAQQSLARARASEVQLVSADYLNHRRAAQWSLVIDGLFGIGLNRAIEGEIALLITQLNQLKRLYHFPVLSLDVPSGLNADTGQIIGEHGVAVVASHTVTFIGNKLGLHTAAGNDYAGHIEVADLGIAAEHFFTPSAYLNNQFVFASALQPRRQDSHKGSFGDVWVIGGAAGMAGAAILAGRAAIYSGAGKVLIGFVGEPPAYDTQHPELMCRHAKDADFQHAAVVIGPGMGDSHDARQVLVRALQVAKALVIDADALNLISADPYLQHLLQQRPSSTIITPHPLEAARLLGSSSTEIQANRIVNAQSLAKKFQATAILKGSGSIVAEPQGQVVVNTTGNPALASAGTGDVLAGICGALLAQDLSPRDAARIAVWVHGSAADDLVQRGTGPIGVTASELIPAVRKSLNQLVTDNLGATAVF